MCDSTLNNIKGIMKITSTPDPISPCSMAVFDSAFYYNQYFNNTIVSADDKGTIATAYTIKFSEKNILPKEFLSDDIFKIEKLRKSKNYAKIFNYYILKDYLFFYVIAKEPSYLFVSKKTGKIKLVSEKQIINDINETGTSLNIRGAIPYSNTLIGYVNSSTIYENSKTTKCKITKLSKDIKEEDNPVIVYYKIKDF